MKKNVFTELILYRYRYAIGYGVFTLALISLFIIAGFFIPGGLTEAEMQSASTSASFSFTNFSTWPIVDLPYHLLQKASIALLGLSDFSIKLPSLILALLTAVGFLLLLLRWFKQNVAVLASIIAVTASQFLVIAQDGTSVILMLFWSTFLLLTATYVSINHKKGFWWKLLFFACAALSLYTPLSLYVLAAMAAAVVLHPHLRFMLLKLSTLKIAACIVVSSVLLVPLIWHLIQSPHTLFTLAGLPDSWPSWELIWGNLQYLAHALFGFMDPVVRQEGLLPLYGISAAALMLLGLFRLIVDHHSARTYTIGLWLILLGVLLILQPQYIAIIFVPMLLMLAVGINTLIQEWYGLFPRNPYARIAALLPLVILLGGIVFTGVDRYTGSYRYSPAVGQYYSKDLSLVREQLKQDAAPEVLVVPQEDHAFYSILTKKHPQLIVTTKAPRESTPMIIAADIMGPSIRRIYGNPSQLVVNSYSDNALRFFVYK